MIPAGFAVNKVFLFATANRNIKSHWGESNNMACLAMFKSVTEKHHIIDTWSFSMIQLVSFTSAVFKAFAEAYLCFLVSALSKKMLRYITKFLKTNVSENKIYFCSRKKSSEVIFVFQTIFKLDFITQIIYCISQRCLCSHSIIFFSYISLSEMEHRNNVNLALFI